MKTRVMIEILRCSKDSRNCGKCPHMENCIPNAFTFPDLVADRLEALLENLRRTEAKLKKTRQYSQRLEKRYERFLHDMKEVVHEQEILSELGGS